MLDWSCSLGIAQATWKKGQDSESHTETSRHEVAVPDFSYKFMCGWAYL